MNTKKVKYITTTSEGKRNEEEYEFFLDELGVKKKQIIEAMREKGVGCYSDMVLPDIWSDLNFEKRNDYVNSNLFDITLKAVFFRNEYEATKDDINILMSFPEIDNLTIWGNQLDHSDIEKLTSLKKITHLCLAGDQFDDEIIESISKFKKMISLDLQTTSISPNGGKHLKELIPEGCQVWLPREDS